MVVVVVAVVVVVVVATIVRSRVRLLLDFSCDYCPILRAMIAVWNTAGDFHLDNPRCKTPAEKAPR